MKKENSFHYDVEKLKLAYEKSMKYLEQKKLYDEFEKYLKNKFNTFKNSLSENQQIKILENKINKNNVILQKYKNIDDAYEKYFNGKIDLTEIEKLLQAKKENMHLNKEINILEKSKKIKLNNYKIEKNDEENYKKIRNDLINFGMDMLDLSQKNLNELGIKTKDIEKFKEKLLKNKFDNSEYFGEDENDRSDLCGKLQLIRLWFDDYFDEKFVLNNKKIVAEMPSPFEFYIKNIEKEFNDKYEKITLVTNDFSEEYWNRDDVTDDKDWGNHYFVYTATLLVPKNISEDLLKSEKNQTMSSIRKLLNENKNIFSLNCRKYEYGKTDDKPKFNEAMRENIRTACQNSKKANEINFGKKFGFDDYYHWGMQDESIVHNLPEKRIAYAIFTTLEYINKLEKIKNIKKLKDKKQEIENVEKNILAK